MNVQLLLKRFLQKRGYRIRYLISHTDFLIFINVLYWEIICKLLNGLWRVIHLSKLLDRVIVGLRERPWELTLSELITVIWHTTHSISHPVHLKSSVRQAFAGQPGGGPHRHMLSTLRRTGANKDSLKGTSTLKWHRL